MSLDQVASWATIIGGVIAALGGGVAVVGVLVRLAKIYENSKQLQPNGGSHLADTVNRAADKLEEMAESVARIEGRLDVIEKLVIKNDG